MVGVASGIGSTDLDHLGFSGESRQSLSDWDDLIVEN